ncbi:hypothetical protein MFFC18_15400 [Mariniblastus fucicola]|uniref:Major facilitator superfamily (MFS) profile domain-containing protein n=1 Tax=Mariniblastus fucicola TaxID=980251 RepID=A0A5B9P9Q9_9BACT|nr:hypothetical protein MFFC18_15400 [Mariniblastus fucicola]
MKRVLGAFAIMGGLVGLVGGILGVTGFIEIRGRRGPLGLVAISCVFLYVGWNWVQDKVAH